jgi:large conductance mechanosensitive channel
MPKFQLYKDVAGKYRFRLRADNNKIIAIGEAYEQYAGCMNGVKSIQKNSKAPIEDTTVEGQRFSNPKFQVYKDNAGKYRFHLYARNGEIIADSSEGYETKDAAFNGISVVEQSDTAEIKDLTETDEIAATDTDEASLTMSTEKKTPQNIEVPKPEETKMDREDEILAELKKISAALEKAPPPVPPKGFVNEFKDFISKYKILGLAVAFILGLYLGSLVQALVKDFIIPLLGLLIPGMSDLATYAVTAMSQVFGVGDFLVALITFIAVALIVFIIVKVAKRMKID